MILDARFVGVPPLPLGLRTRLVVQLDAMWIPFLGRPGSSPRPPHPSLDERADWFRSGLRATSPTSGLHSLIKHMQFQGPVALFLNPVHPDGFGSGFVVENWS